MDWLESNLELSFPFVDGAEDPLVNLMADALVLSPVPGAYTLSIFDPQAGTNAHVKITQGATVILETFVATVASIGSYFVLNGVDSARGSSFRFITTDLSAYAFLASPMALVPTVCKGIEPTVSSLDTLTGAVIVHLPNYATVNVANNVATISFAAPADRVDCTSYNCTYVSAINGVNANNFGSFNIVNDLCYRLVPNSDASTLTLFNFCAPCTSCTDVATLNTYYTELINYYYELAAIYNFQFNQVQKGTGKALSEITTAQTAAAAPVTGDGFVDLTGRSFNKPYFSQLQLGIVNSTTRTVSAAITVTITPSGLAAGLTTVPSSTVVQRFGSVGAQYVPFNSLPGSGTLTLEPNTSLAITSEVHVSNFELLTVTNGMWNATVVVTFLGSSPPSPVTLTRSFPLSYIASPITTP